MKLPPLSKSIESDVENRKRAFQRREMGQAYRKNAQYQATKNPLLEALENLLSGKTERDLQKAGQEERDIEDLLAPQSLIERKQIEQAEEDGLNPFDPSIQEVPRAVDEAAEIWKRPIDESEDEVLVTAEKAADFTGSEKVKASEPFIDRFTERNVLHGSLLAGRQLESRAQQHLFEVASASYLQHIAMVKNNYRSVDEPSYSKIA